MLLQRIWEILGVISDFKSSEALIYLNLPFRVSTGLDSFVHHESKQAPDENSAHFPYHPTKNKVTVFRLLSQLVGSV